MNCPLSAFSHPDCYRFHDPAAIVRTVARRFINVQTGQAVTAVIAVLASGIFRRIEPAAHPAGEAVGTGMGLIIAFFKLKDISYPVGGFRFSCQQTSRLEDHRLLFHL